MQIITILIVFCKRIYAKPLMSMLYHDLYYACKEIIKIVNDTLDFSIYLQ